MRTPGLRLRQAQAEDAPGLVALLNRVIDEGDKTAIASPLDPREFREWFITGAHCLGCVVAEADDGTPRGFQAHERYHDDLPAGWADVATYVDRAARGSGVGRLLIGATLTRARATGTTTLRAVIRQGNDQAVRYYRRCGFREPDDTGLGGSATPGTVTLVRPVAQRRPERATDPA